MLLLVSFLPPLLRSPSLMRLSISGFLGWGSQGKGCQCELFCTLKGLAWTLLTNRALRSYSTENQLYNQLS